VTRALQAFRAAFAKAGLDYAGDIIADGKFVRWRCREAGDKDRASWFILFPGEPLAGAFGNFRLGHSEDWCARRRDQFTDAEWRELRRKWSGAARERERAQAQLHERAHKMATWILSRAKPVTTHAYLTAKGVNVFGDVQEYRGALVLPLRDMDGVLHSLQFIGADGTKRFLSGGKIAGCFFTVADTPDGPLVIAEGFATAASIAEATGFATVAAMNAGNLPAVAKALREKFPSREIIICADNDQFTDGNPGVTKATEAAKAIGAKLAVPQFKDAAAKPTDFNDLHQSQGASTVKEQIQKSATPPETVTPAQWFSEKFPSLAGEYGDAILEEADKDGTVSAKDIGEDFLAATLGEKGTPDAPTIFLPTEERFYTYTPSEGIFIQQREPGLLARLSRLLLECARACREGCETKTLEFRFRDAANLSGVLKKARGLLEVPHDYFASDLTKFIPCANGMLRLKDKTLLPFSPAYRRRNKLAVPFDPAAKCPLFIETLMRQALDGDELDLLQRWCGLALIGENLAQRILILTGTAGGGKGTFIRVLNGIVGEINLASLRTQLLGERFELGRFLGRTLLYGADVPENFLNQRGASILKSLTGYDPVTLEFKNSNESPSIICKFNIVVTCNSRLTVHLEGDTDAWRRRLAIIEYHKPKPDKVIADLDKRILTSEASGVLNWMLAGLDKLRADDWQLHLTREQQGRVDNLLLESDGHSVFVRECLKRDASQSLTVPDCFAAYVEFCTERGWTTLTKNKFGALIGDVMVRQFAITMRHDIPDTSGKMQRGWKGLCLARNFPEPTDKKASETSGSQPGAAFPDATDTFSQVQPAEIPTEEAPLIL
jgi:P4 family phage/plasmid primase-like protien